MKIEIDLEKLIEKKITCDQYILLYCLHTKSKDLLQKYKSVIGKFTNSDFSELEAKGYLVYPKSKEKISYEDLTLKSKFVEEFLPNLKNTVSFELAFEQLLDHFPKKVPDGYGGYRYLHQDLDRSKKLYRNIIAPNGIVDEELHATILQCLNFQLKGMSKGLQLKWLQMVPTWLNQKTYMLYKEEVEQLNRSGQYIDKQTNNGGKDNFSIDA